MGPLVGTGPLTDTEFRDWDLLVRAQDAEARIAEAQAFSAKTKSKIARMYKKQINRGTELTGSKTTSNPIALERLKNLQQTKGETE